jgi:hypothetical protein
MSEKNVNSTVPESQLRKGYSTLAKHMTVLTAGNSALIFRRFDRLNARNLLILESQIASLEFRLAQLEKEGAETKGFAEGLQDWDVLRDHANSEEEPVLSQRAMEVV